MRIEDALFSYLSTQPGLSALVGDRVYPLVLPQKPTLPAVTYQLISGGKIQSKDGASGLARPRYQFSCWSTSYLQAKEVAHQICSALVGYKGLMGGAGGVTVETSIYDDETDIYEPETGRYHIPVDVILWYRE